MIGGKDLAELLTKFILLRRKSNWSENENNNNNKKIQKYQNHINYSFVCNIKEN